VNFEDDFSFPEIPIFTEKGEYYSFHIQKPALQV
jgi:hypothetical protein